MTEHVRKNYRNHRKATWGFAIALMVAIAAVVIPIASGAGKTYTMLFPSTGAVTPAPPVSGNTTSQTLCSGSNYTVKVAITNTANTQQLGSADVTFPANVTLSSAASPAGSPTAWQISRSGNVVSLRQLSLPKNGVVTITAALGTGGAATSAQAITARVKQSNDFSDSGSNPNANGFDNPTFPTIQRSGLHRDHHRPRVPRPRPERRVRGQPLVADERHRKAGVDGHSAAQDGCDHLCQRRLRHRRTRTACTRSKARSAATSGCASLHPTRLTARASWGVRAVPGVTLADGCAPITPTSDASTGALRAESVQRGGDRTGLRSRSDHDAELRRRQTHRRRELHRHGRRQHDEGPRSTTCRRRGPTATATRTSCSRRSTPARVAPARSTCSSRCPARSCRAISGRPTRSCSSTTTPSPSRRSRRCRTASRILAGPGNTLLVDRRPSGRRNLVHRRGASDGGRRRYGRECIGRLHVLRLHVVRR